MPMTPSVYTISGLSVELGRDRRTVAGALRNVPPDGKRQGHPAWRLETALHALKGGSGGNDRDGGISWVWLVRLNNEVPMHERGGECSVEMFAQAAEADVEDVLTWLRIGMPYLVAGDLKTGEGFVLRFSWSAEWYALTRAHLLHRSDAATRSRLGFHL